MYCTVLYCIVLYCIVLYCIVLYSIALHCIALYYIIYHQDMDLPDGTDYVMSDIIRLFHQNGLICSTTMAVSTSARRTTGWASPTAMESDSMCTVRTLVVGAGSGWGDGGGRGLSAPRQRNTFVLKKCGLL